MDALDVALVYYDRERAHPDIRPYGWWSYDVPEFNVTYYPVEINASLDAAEMVGRHDIIVQEDYNTRITWTDGIPRAYHVVDSVVSEGHYQDRLRWGRGADLILVDQDKLERFAGLDVPVRRFSYCVNDQKFHDLGLERDIDIGWYFRAPLDDNHPRRKLHHWLETFCERRGYTYSAGKRLDLSGPIPEYARYFNRSKVAINLANNDRTRTHRVFDAMACGCALVTSPVPAVSGEHRACGWHYLEFGSYGELATILDDLLEADTWQDLARSGHDLVMREHTWAVRARQLRETLAEALGL